MFQLCFNFFLIAIQIKVFKSFPKDEKISYQKMSLKQEIFDMHQNLYLPPFVILYRILNADIQFRKKFFSLFQK